MLQERKPEPTENRGMKSIVTPSVKELPAATRAGADLKAARERLGLSLRDVAFSLCIRLPHLQALEEGRLSSLPGNAYALAFVRGYAGTLGLDPEEMVRRFKTESAACGQPTELVFPVPMPERGLPAGAMLLLGLVLVIGAYVGWYRLSGEGRLPAETVTAVPERLAALADQALPRARPLPDAAAPAAQKIVPTDLMTQEMLANPAPPVMAISPGSAAAAQLPRQKDAMAGDGVPPMTGLDTPDVGRVVVHASADAWLLVKDRNGAVLLNRILKAGETWLAPSRRDLLLTTGNAGATDIVLDGATVPSLGALGAVRHDLPLDPAMIRYGKLASPFTMTRAR